MNITLYMAISIDGCITRGQDDSDWVSEADWNVFETKINASDAIIMGRRTMEQFGDDFPVAGAVNIVLTKDANLHKTQDDLIIMQGSPADVVDKAESLGFENILLIGGAETNKQFLKAGLIDEVILSVHPLVIGKGLRLFGEDHFDTQLELLETNRIAELVQLRYRVVG